METTPELSFAQAVKSSGEHPPDPSTRQIGAQTNNGIINLDGSVAAYAGDVVVLPSRTRPGRGHQVALNVLANEPSGCTCEAWTHHDEWCWAMKEVAAQECSYPLQRCAEAECGAILRLGRFWTGSGYHQDIFVCPRSENHSRREAAAARLLRTEQPVVVSSNGCWRLA